MALRNFIFIDKNKMYSFYSQIFEGVAESLVKSVFYSSEDKNMTGKRLEETLIEASNGTDERLIYEGSDLLYHLIVLLTSKGYRIEDLANELRERHQPNWKKH